MTRASSPVIAGSSALRFSHGVQTPGATLDGYAGYAKRVRYRLVPWVW